MSERWYAKSFKSAISFSNSANFEEKTIANIKLLEIISIIPILCWFEKVLLLIDYCQLFALLWITAQPWPWPYLWSDYTRFIVYTNIDLFSTSPNGALVGRSSSLSAQWGKMDDYPAYALKFAIVQFGLFAVILYLRRKWDAYGEVSPERRHRNIAILLCLSYVLYIPCSLATFRLYYCDADPHVLSADPEIQCFGTEHSIYFAICSALTLPVFFGLPYIIYRYIENSVVYHYETDHEKRLQVWEILQMLSLDDHWLRKQLWLTSSFNKFGAYYRLHMLLLKAWFLILFIFFRFNLRLQCVLFVFSTAIFCLYYSLGGLINWRKYLPYRNFNSNLMMLCTFGLMITNTIFGMFNQFGVRNAITVGSTESYFLWAASFCATMITGAIIVYEAITSKVFDWPSVHTMNRIWHNEELVEKVALWVQSMRESYVVRADFLLAAPEVADVNALEESIRVLRCCWLSARSIGSLFEVPLSEALEELLFIHATRYPEALRKHPYWNSEYVKPEVRANLQKRYYDHSLMAPKKRRVLFKLLAIRFMKGDRGEFSMDVALKQARQDEEDKLIRAKHEAELLALVERRKQEIAAQQQSAKVNHFSNFSSNAQFLLFGAASHKADGTASASGAVSPDHMEKGKDGASTAPTPKHFDAIGEEVEESGPRFAEQDMEEARRMIARLIKRTEEALNKHHNTKVKMIEQENQALATAIAQNSSSVALVGGIGKISTMELIKETVDIEEQNDLEELYFLWDEAIQLYELEEFPGDYEQLNRSAENWYTYRGLVTQRLEVVARTLHERDYEALIDNHDVIEEGEESDEEDEDHGLISKGTKGPGHISPRLQQLQQLSSRALLPKKPVVEEITGFDTV